VGLDFSFKKANEQVGLYISFFLFLFFDGNFKKTNHGISSGYFLIFFLFLNRFQKYNNTPAIIQNGQILIKKSRKSTNLIQPY